MWDYLTKRCGYSWQKDRSCLFCNSSSSSYTRSSIATVSDSGDELSDRMTLLLKVLVWLRDNDRLAFDAACEKIRKECGK